MIDIDILGTLYTPGEYDAEGNATSAPVALPGYHVNTTHPVAQWEDYEVVPTTPRRVFGGHPTFFYSFDSQAEYEALLETTDLTIPIVIKVPYSITRAQAKLAMLGAGVLSSVQPAIDAVADPVQRQAMQIEWDDRLTFERSNPTLIALAAGLGMTSEQLDQLFIVGATL